METTSIPNPLCEVGRTHPRDKHRMRPIEGQSGVWECTRHGLFAKVVDKDAAAQLERGDEIEMHDGGKGIIGRTGDERPGGVVLYYRRAEG